MSEDKIKATDFFRLVSTALTELCREVESVEDVLFKDVIAKKAEVSSNALAEIQKIDLIVQSIEAYSEILSSISEQAPEEWMICSDRAKSRITLEAVRNRISNNVIEPKMIVNTSPELF